MKKKMNQKELEKLRKTRMELEEKAKLKRAAMEEIMKIRELSEELHPTARGKLKKFLSDLPEKGKELSKSLKEGEKKLEKLEKKFEEIKEAERKRGRNVGSLQSI